MTKEHEELERKLRAELNSKEHLTTDELALRDRLNGRQPTLNICGQTYYVNWNMQTLERKDDLNTQGIMFIELQDYYTDDFTRCELPYNKKTHQVEDDFDQNTITEMPEDVVIVSFPPPKDMDPVGFSRCGGEDLKDLLEENPQGRHFVAAVLEGDDSWLEYIVNSNKKKQDIPPLKVKGRSRGKGI